MGVLSVEADDLRGGWYAGTNIYNKYDINE